jgi:hypothetical protein
VIRFVPAIPFAPVVRLWERLAQDDGVPVHPDVRDGARPNFSVARVGLIPAVVPLAS